MVQRMSDMELASIVVRALIMIIKALIKKYELNIKLND